MTCPDPGDTTFQFVCTLLVLGMMPALAFFEAGLLRRRSALSIITQVFLGLSALNLLWLAFGFSLVFGGTHGYVIGDFRYAGFSGLSNECLPHAPEIPGVVYALFNMMFASITPLLMTGGFAERIRILGFVPFVVAWQLLVYIPVAHQIWGAGWLSNLGVVDFAGGITIHVTAGVGSTVSALVLGRRVGFEKYHGEFPPHNVPLAAVGTAMLFTGWNGFNAGSAYAAGFLAVQASANTVLGASAGAAVWAVISLIRNRKRIDPIFVLNGLVAGMAGITPCSGYVSSWGAVVAGTVVSLAAFGSLWLLKHKLCIDDALDVGSIHGVPGAVGALMTGLLGDPSINPDAPLGGFLGGGARPLGVQLAGVMVAGVWTALVTLPLIWGLHRMAWFTLQPQHQALGLDGKDHEISAYNAMEFSEDEEHPFLRRHPTASSLNNTAS